MKQTEVWLATGTGAPPSHTAERPVHARGRRRASRTTRALPRPRALARRRAAVAAAPRPRAKPSRRRDDDDDDDDDDDGGGRRRRRRRGRSADRRRRRRARARDDAADQAQGLRVLRVHGLAALPRRPHGGPERARVPNALPTVRRDARVHADDSRAAVRGRPKVPSGDLHDRGGHRGPPAARAVLRERPGDAPRRGEARRAALRRRGHQFRMPATHREEGAIRRVSHGRLEDRARSDIHTRQGAVRARHGEDTRVRRLRDVDTVRGDGAKRGRAARRDSRADAESRNARRTFERIGRS